MVSDQLIELGLPPRLAMLYGRIVFHTEDDGLCYRKWKTLAKEIGLNSRSSRITVYRLLRQLKALKLVEWNRSGRYTNEYRALVPDVAFLQRQRLQECNVSDVARMQPIRESSSREPSKRTSSPTPSPRRESAGTQNKKTRKLKNSDDDEKPKPRQQAASPEAEFRERLTERHGAIFDVERCMQNVRRQLDKAGGVTMADFLAADLERTTAPTAINNPNGYYTQLAKGLRHDAVAAAHAAIFDPLKQAGADAPVEPERNSHGRCVECNGLGKLPAGGFCRCQLGRDLEAQERRGPVAKKGPATAKGRKILNFPKKGATT